MFQIDSVIEKMGVAFALPLDTPGGVETPIMSNCGYGRGLRDQLLMLMVLHCSCQGDQREISQYLKVSI